MKRLMLILITVRISLSGISQEIITSSGGTYSNEDITLSWTIGEGITETYERNEINLNQGFQQNIDIIPFTSQSNTLQGVEFTLYPNPVSEILNIDLSAANDSELIIDIFDINGKILTTIKKSKNHKSAQIELSEFHAGEYIMKIYSKDNYINNSYVIIKYQ
jgi:hypothetical protein